MPAFAFRRQLIAEQREAQYFAILWSDPSCDRGERLREMRQFLGPIAARFESLDPGYVDHADHEALVELFTAVRDHHAWLLRPRPRRRPRPPKTPITDIASCQRVYDRHYANRENAIRAGLGSGPEPPPFELKPPRRRAPPVLRPRREPAIRNRQEVRESRSESRGPPNAAGDDDPDPDPDPDDDGDCWQPLGDVLLRLVNRLADDFLHGGSP
jgi:hypothetical protein